MSQGVLSFECEQNSFNNGEVLYFPNFFQEDYLNLLEEVLAWEKSEITMFGKTHPIPRMHCWYADSNVNYQYSNIKIRHNDWCEPLIKIKKQIEEKLCLTFNGMLGNYYRNGEDYVSWHSDDEESLGTQPTIVCASFGVTRVFSLRNKETRMTTKLKLDNRSLLVMHPPTQRDWEHQLNKIKSINQPRISLTFRFVHQ